MKDSHQISSSYGQLFNVRAGQFLLPAELRSLILSIAEPHKNQAIYCAYDTVSELAHHISLIGAKTCIEIMDASLAINLANLMPRDNVEIQVSNPVICPSYLDKNGGLKLFDTSISFPPMGVKFDRKTIEEDPFNRFPEQAASGSVYQIRHIIAQTNGKAIIVVPNSVLFSRGGEHLLRQDLVKRGIVQAVISLPSAILPSTAVNISVLVLDTSKPLESIRFIDGSNPEFFERDGKNRSQLVHWQALADVYHSNKDGVFSKTIAKEEVLQNDAYLEVSRYVLPPEQIKAQKLLSSAHVLQLSQLVDFIRPIPKLLGESDRNAYETSIADFPDFGYLPQPQRTTKLTAEKFSEKEMNTFLRPNDIIIATKGSVGKIAIVPNDIPKAGAGGWIVNQSCLILRTKNQTAAKALYMYLRSQLGQTLIKGIVSGATIPMIQLQALKQLQIVLPTKRSKILLQKVLINRFN